MGIPEQVELARRFIAAVRIAKAAYIAAESALRLDVSLNVARSNAEKEVERLEGLIVRGCENDIPAAWVIGDEVVVALDLYGYDNGMVHVATIKNAP